MMFRIYVLNELLLHSMVWHSLVKKVIAAQICYSFMLQELHRSTNLFIEFSIALCFHDVLFWSFLPVSASRCYFPVWAN